MSCQAEGAGNVAGKSTSRATKKENFAGHQTTVIRLVYLLISVLAVDRLLFYLVDSPDAGQGWILGKDLGLWLTVAACVFLRYLFKESPAKKEIQDAPRTRGVDSDDTVQEQKEVSLRKRAAAPSRPTPKTSSPIKSTQEVLVQRLNQAIYTSAWNGDCNEALRLLKEMKENGLQPEATTYNLILRGFAKKGDVRAAERLLRQMETEGVDGTICSYNTVLDACSKAGDAEACDRWLTRMLANGPQVNVISFATLIYAWAKRGDETKARYWFERMTEAKVEPDTVCYNSMIHACSITGNSEMADVWMQEMQARGITPTVMTFTTLIDGCAKAGDLSRAEKWFNAMEAQKIEPNQFTYCAMIDGCARAANLSRAEFWHDKMVRKGLKPNMHIISAIINACAKECDVDAAEKWLGVLEKEGNCDVVAYTSVIDACGKAGDADRALKIFQRMEASGLRPHIVAYSALAKPFAYKGDWEMVEQLAQNMKKYGVHLNEYFLYAQLVAYASARPRQVQRAEACFRAAARQGVKINDHVITALTRAVGRGRSLQLSEELCSEVQKEPSHGPKATR